MSLEPFDPADASCWLSRGRAPDHAAAIAAAWRDYPDLSFEASLDARMQRSRDRASALRPVHDAIRVEAERARVAANFAFAERHADRVDDMRYRTIIEARDRHGLGWNEAVAYADGYYAACTGWPANPHGGVAQKAAYQLGFREGGGRPEDPFDTARGAFAAANPATASAAAPPGPTCARPLPSSWPLPSDAPLPARWSARLLIVGTGTDPAFATELLDEVRRHAGYEEACILTVDAASRRGPARDRTPRRSLAWSPIGNSPTCLLPRAAPTWHASIRRLRLCPCAGRRSGHVIRLFSSAPTADVAGARTASGRSSRRRPYLLGKDRARPGRASGEVYGALRRPGLPTWSHRPNGAG